MVPLGITETLYILKHMHSTAVVDLLSDEGHRDAREIAAKINGHTTTAMLDKTYDLSKEERERSRLKALRVPLVKS